MIRALQEAVSRLLAVVFKRTHDREFDEELSTHVALLTARNRERGMSEAEARRQAILSMGGVRATQDLHRETRGLPRLERLTQACSQAMRSWRSAKAVTLLAALALAIGTGSATAIYSLVNAAMFKPLPYSEGERFVALARDASRLLRLRSEDSRQFMERSRVFDAFGWFRESGKNAFFAGEPHHVPAMMVTQSLVERLGVTPMLGQWFHDETGAVISASLWRRFGGHDRIIGQTVALDGENFVVTGVMPDSFHLPVDGMISTGARVDAWLPLDPRENAGAAYIAYARLRPEATVASANADVARIAAELTSESPNNHRNYTVRVLPLRETVTRNVRPTLLLLFGAAGLLFLITCANAAGLLLARSVSRAQETAVRVALGASRGHLAVHYFAEGLLVSLAGGLGGVALSIWATPAIVAMAPEYVPRADEIAVDWRVLLFAVGAAVIASVLSSVAPFRHAARMAPIDALRAGSRSTSRHASRSLVVAELALAFALLAASAVMLAHVRALARTWPGFDADRIVSVGVSIPGSVASNAAVRIPLQRRMVSTLEAIPGVEEVGFARQLPFAGCCWSSFLYPDGQSIQDTAQPRTNLMAASAGYFRVMRIPLRRGRFLKDEEISAPGAPVPVLVNETAARAFWGDRDPVGAYARVDSATGPRVHVVGVVADVMNGGFGNPTQPEIYESGFATRIETMRMILRSDRSKESLLADVRRAIRAIDPEQPLHVTGTMREFIQSTMTLERAVTLLTSVFAASALLMAMLGVYGVVSYAVKQRTSEIGMRLAMGASATDVLRLIVGDGLKMAAYAVIVGAGAAIGAALYLSSVFQLGELSMLPFLYSTATVAAIACAGSFLPAWRATRLSPLHAIRRSG
jgi:predicted permease